MPKTESGVFSWCCKPQTKGILNFKVLSFGIYFSILPALSLCGKQADKTQESTKYLFLFTL